MKIKTNVALLLTMVAASTQGGLLDSLNNGIDKWNQTVDKVNNGSNSANETDKKSDEDSNKTKSDSVGQTQTQNVPDNQARPNQQKPAEAVNNESQFEQFRNGKLEEATEMAKQEKAKGKLVFKNLYLGMPLKNAVAVLESLLGEKFDLQENGEKGFRLGIYHDRTMLNKAAQISAARSGSKVRNDGTIVTADASGNCIEFIFGRKNLDKIYNTPELEGEKFFYEFVKNYNVQFETSSYIPKMKDLTFGSIDLGSYFEYEAIDDRGVKLYFYVNKYVGDQERMQAGMAGLETETLVLQLVASQSQREKKFD